MRGQPSVASLYNLPPGQPAAAWHLPVTWCFLKVVTNPQPLYVNTCCRQDGRPSVQAGVAAPTALCPFRLLLGMLRSLELSQGVRYVQFGSKK